MLDPPWQPTIIYPARGIADLWQDARSDASRALARLLGATRASVLVALVEPLDTTTLARRFAVAPSTLSEHLHTLRTAGLVQADRDRRRVLYRRTPLGTALCAANGEGVDS